MSKSRKKLAFLVVTVVMVVALGGSAAVVLVGGSVDGGSADAVDVAQSNACEIDCEEWEMWLDSHPDCDFDESGECDVREALEAYGVYQGNPALFKRKRSFE